MLELFIYYRIRPGMSGSALAAVASMQDELRAAHPGLEARLLRRTDAVSGRETWMETYAARAAGGAGVDAASRAAIASRSAALADFIDGPRRTEPFEVVELP